jgi:hypothetical protein
VGFEYGLVVKGMQWELRCRLGDFEVEGMSNGGFVREVRLWWVLGRGWASEWRLVEGFQSAVGWEGSGRGSGGGWLGFLENV